MGAEQMQRQQHVAALTTEIQRLRAIGTALQVPLFPCRDAEHVLLLTGCVRI